MYGFMWLPCGRIRMAASAFMKFKNMKINSGGFAWQTNISTHENYPLYGIKHDLVAVIITEQLCRMCEIVS